MTNRGQKTSYTGKDTSVSITQTQDADQSQSVITNDRLRGDWSPRVIYARHYKPRNNRPETTQFHSISPNGPVKGTKPEFGETHILGYALVRPDTNTSYSKTKDEAFGQYAAKDEAYVFELNRPVFVPKEGLTVRFAVQSYHVNHRKPMKSGWARFHVPDTRAMIQAGNGARIAAVSEVPPRTSFAFPFRTAKKLEETLESRAESVHFNPDFERIA